MNQEKRTQNLKDALKPLYVHLIDTIKRIPIEYSTAFFCAQWGKNFPFEQHCGIIFVGRATNGWITDCDDVEVLFGEDQESAIFNRKDQMQWVEDLAGNKAGYNTNKSAFWRVIKAVSCQFYSSNWSSHVAWSDVCKVAPFEGDNPDNTLYSAQLEDCQKILQTEINILSPKIVVLFTGKSWAKDFLEYLNGNVYPKSICKDAWSECQVYQIAGVTYILTEHPQGKKEQELSDCLIQIINKYN